DGVYIWFYQVNDSSNNTNYSNNFTLTIDKIVPNIDFTSPTLSTGSSITAKNIEINVTVNDTNFKNLSIYLFNSTRGLINSSNTTNSSLYVNFQGLPDGDYYFNATTYDLAGNINYTETRKINIYTETTNPSQGSNSITYIVFYERLCQLTYPLALNNSDATNLEIYNANTVYNYIHNWQFICSDKMNLTLNPGYVCNKIYYFLLGTKSLNQTISEINKEVNVSDYLFSHYLNNYNKECYLNNYSAIIEEKAGTIYINETQEIRVCQLKESEIDKYYIPFFVFYFGVTDCETMNNFNWLFKFENKNNNLSIIGIKLWVIFLILSAIIIFAIYKVNGNFKKFFKKKD
ncbi:MAG: hypothetical protein WCX82_04930, partial [archaeon]